VPPASSERPEKTLLVAAQAASANSAGV